MKEEQDQTILNQLWMQPEIKNWNQTMRDQTSLNQVWMQHVREQKMKEGQQERE